MFLQEGITSINFTCQEGEEESEAVEEDELEEENDSDVPLAVLPHAAVDEGHEHVVEVNTEQARGETEKRENMLQTPVINENFTISNAIHISSILLQKIYPKKLSTRQIHQSFILKNLTISFELSCGL